MLGLKYTIILASFYIVQASLHKCIHGSIAKSIPVQSSKQQMKSQFKNISEAHKQMADQRVRPIKIHFHISDLNDCNQTQRNLIERELLPKAKEKFERLLAVPLRGNMLKITQNDCVGVKKDFFIIL